MVEKHTVGDIEGIVFFGVEEGKEVIDYEYRLVGTRQYLLPAEAYEG